MGMTDIFIWVSLFEKRNILYKKQYINKRNNLNFSLKCAVLLNCIDYYIYYAKLRFSVHLLRN